jgi:16S rRNA (adenine1518-N6/adenine1519-N6)-dimethyltransferase
MLHGKAKDAGGTLTLIEPDEKLADKLGIVFPDAKVIIGRAERVDLSALPGPLTVVSNLPYYVSVHIYKHCIEHKANISRMVLMFQKEVARRISASPGVKRYGSLSVLSRYHWEIEELMTVKAASFKPKPKVDSTVLRFVPHSRPPVVTDPEKMFRLVRAAFTHKRRTLKNNLKNLYDPESLEKALRSAGLDEKSRAEAISLRQFSTLADLLD